MWTWYSIQVKLTANATEVKFLQAKARLLSRPTTTSLISLSANYVRPLEEAASKMEGFLRHASIVLTPAAIP